MHRRFRRAFTLYDPAHTRHEWGTVSPSCETTWTTSILEPDTPRDDRFRTGFDSHAGLP